MKQPTIWVGGKRLTEEEAGLLVVGLCRIIRDPEEDEGEADAAANLMEKLVAKAPAKLDPEMAKRLVNGAKVACVEAVGNVEEGDTGVITDENGTGLSRDGSTMVLVRMDKDGTQRFLFKRRLRVIEEE